jgi:molybdopterin-synthase adenylyltransferase
MSAVERDDDDDAPPGWGRPARPAVRVRADEVAPPRIKLAPRDLQPAIEVKRHDLATTGTRQHDRSRLVQAGWSTRVLDDAFVIVVGAGALGNEVLKNLALVGVRHVLIVDPDTIEAANLVKSILFREEDVGRPKAPLAAERVRSIEGRLRTHGLVGFVQRLFGPGLYRRADLVVCCVDNLQARIDLAHLCTATRTPLIEGGVLGLSGRASAWFGPETACFDCGLLPAAREGAMRRTSCPGVVVGEVERPSVPFTPTISSLIASVMSQWAVEVLHGRLDRSSALELVYEGGGKRVDASVTRVDLNPECPGHAMFRHPGTGAWHTLVDEPLESTPWTVDTSVAEVLERGRARLGVGRSAKLELELSWDFAPTATCTGCGEVRMLRRRRDEILADELECPGTGCPGGEPFDMLPDYLLGERAGRVTTGSRYESWALRELVCRPFDLLHVRDCDTNARVSFEVAGHLELLGPIGDRPIRSRAPVRPEPLQMSGRATRSVLVVTDEDEPRAPAQEQE